MTLRLVFSRRAQDDMDEVWAYIAGDNPVAAEEVCCAFVRTAKELARHPEMGRRRDELGPNLRSFTTGNYVIFYRCVSDCLQIHRILHGGRDLPQLL